MKIIIACLLFFKFIACVTNREKPPEPEVPAVPVTDEVLIPVIEKPSTLKRTIKDVDLKKSIDDKSPRKASRGSSLLRPKSKSARRNFKSSPDGIYE